MPLFPKHDATARCPNLIRMFSRIRVITVFVCIWLGIAPQFALAAPPKLGKDLISMIRSYQSPVAKNEAGASVPGTDGASAMSHQRVAKNYADQNDVSKANTHFGLALKNATPKQIPAIASDYATFLMNIGDLHKAELILRQGLAQSPNDEYLIRMLARCLVLQDKTFEGLRYFKSIYSEAEAKEIVASIYREQGNTEKLAAAERQWGTPGMSRQEIVHSAPVLIASTPKPSVQPPATPVRVVTPLPHAEVVSAVPSTVRTLPPAPSMARPKETMIAPPEEIAIIAAVPVVPPRSRSEFFDKKVPIPVPAASIPISAPQPMVAMTRSPLSISTAPVPRLPAPTPATEKLALDNLAMMNPVKLPTAPAPVLAALPEDREPPRPAVTVQQRRHYVINAEASADLDALFPVKPAAACVLVQ